jgi:hypothetical protein
MVGGFVGDGRGCGGMGGDGWMKDRFGWYV